MPRAMQVEYPGAIYHVMDRGDRREDILIIGTAKGAKSVLHRSGRGQHQYKPARAVFFAILFGLTVVPVFAQKQEYKEAHVYVTAPATDTTPAQLLADCGFQAFAPLEQPNEHDPAIIVDDSKTFQTIEGFGGAFTDAAATVFGKLAPDAQEEFLKACFDPVEGNGYTLCH
jgi:hypothetical protein